MCPSAGLLLAILFRLSEECWPVRMVDGNGGFVSELELFRNYVFTREHQQGRYMTHQISDTLLQHGFMNDFLGSLHNCSRYHHSQKHMAVAKYASI